jgi:hypothetical protein
MISRTQSLCGFGFFLYIKARGCEDECVAHTAILTALREQRCAMIFTNRTRKYEVLR